MDEISIERLVLDVPGLSPDAAHDLAQQVAAGLAAAAPPAQGGSFDSLAVNLDGFDRGNLSRLADAIVQSVMRQIG